MTLTLERPTSRADLEQRIRDARELRDKVVAKAAGREPWIPWAHQVPPDYVQYVWLLLAGRGAGKTDACAYYFDRWMTEHPGTRGRIVAPTLGDAVGSCVEGVSGLKAHNPRVRFIAAAGGYQVRWPNGSVAKLFGAYSAEDVERLRAGGNSALDWWEELAAWRFLGDALDQIRFGLRTPPHPHAVASTTPKPRPQLKELMADPATTMSRASTDDNPKLPQFIRDQLHRKYDGTRLGRQELEGEIIDDVEGALWTTRMLDGARIRGAVPDLRKVVVAVDPSGGDEEGNDEQGLIVAGLGVDGRGYILADRSCKLSPGGWGKRAIRAWQMFNAGEIVAETNYGGAMVKSTIDVAARDMAQAGVHVEVITASRGKVQRAEPVAALYEQGRVSHVEYFAELERQMTQWTPDSGWSPDRMDALVWALTRLMVDAPKRRRMRPAAGGEARALPGARA